MKKIWEILGIQKTKDATKIKDAYYEKLRDYTKEKYNLDIRYYEYEIDWEKSVIKF